MFQLQDRPPGVPLLKAFSILDPAKLPPVDGDYFPSYGDDKIACLVEVYGQGDLADLKPCDVQ